jgi:hypothetical protein
MSYFIRLCHDRVWFWYVMHFSKEAIEAFIDVWSRSRTDDSWLVHLFPVLSLETTVTHAYLKRRKSWTDLVVSMRSPYPKSSWCPHETLETSSLGKLNGPLVPACEKGQSCRVPPCCCDGDNLRSTNRLPNLHAISRAEWRKRILKYAQQNKMITGTWT